LARPGGGGEPLRDHHDQPIRADQHPLGPQLKGRAMLTLENVEYRYRGASKNSLRGVSGTFEAGKLNMIVGKSGSGKTTLLSLLAGLDVATKGRILRGDDDLATVDRDAYRAKTIGVVFQAYNLL